MKGRLSRTSVLSNVRVLAVLLTIGAIFAVIPLWPGLLLAAWVGELARPVLRRVLVVVGRRERAAALVTMGIIVSVTVPIAGLVFAVISEALDLYEQLRQSGADRSLFVALVAPGSNGTELPPIGLKEIVDLIKSYGERAWQLAIVLGATATSMIVGIVVFFWGTYAMLSGGHAGRVWAERNFGFPPFAVRRMYAAFMETGRGLFVGVGATSFVQAVVATLTFLALGVPRAFLFGALTLFCSIIPALGSGIVWAPIAIGLALQGEPGKAALLVGIGVFVIGTVDNLVRPMFARFGALKMSTFSLFVTMLGGIALLGPFGILAGPLLFRCAREALELRTEIAAGKARMTEPCPPAAAPREAPAVRFRGGSLAHEASEA